MITSVYHNEGIEEEVVRAFAQVRWLKHFMKHVHELDPIQNITRLYGCWESERLYLKDTPARYKFGIRPKCWLTYVGEGTTEEEARTDLALIMQTTSCIFGDILPGTMCSAYWFNKAVVDLVHDKQHDFHGEYGGLGKIGKLPVDVILYVPWLPIADCKFNVEIVEIKSRERWSLDCGPQGKVDEENI